MLSLTEKVIFEAIFAIYPPENGEKMKQKYTNQVPKMLF